MLSALERLATPIAEQLRSLQAALVHLAKHCHRDAMQLAWHLGPSWKITTRAPEAATLLTSIIPEASAGPTNEDALGLMACADLLAISYQLERAATYAQLTEGLLPDLGDPELELSARSVIVRAYVRSSRDHQEALMRLDALEADFPNMPAIFRFNLYQCRGDSLMALGQIVESNDAYRQAMEWALAAGSDRGYAIAQMNASCNDLAEGHYASARARLEEARMLLRQTPHFELDGQAFLELNLGHIANVNGEADEAMGHYQRSLEIADRIGHDLATKLTALGIAALLRGDRPRRAAILLGFSDAIDGNPDPDSISSARRPTSLGPHRFPGGIGTQQSSHRRSIGVSEARDPRSRESAVTARCPLTGRGNA